MGKADHVETLAQVELKSSFIGSTFSALFRLTQVVQAIPATVLWWVMIRPLVLVFRGERPSGGETSVSEDDAESKKEPKKVFEYRIDYAKRLHRIVWWVIVKTHSLGERIAGMHSDRSLYERLLTWESTLSVLAYRDQNNDIAIHFFGKPYEDGSRAFDIFWLGRPLPAGRFRVVRKTLQTDAENNGKVTIDGVWITGEHAGMSFDLGPDFMRYKTWNKESLAPSHIYTPPKFLLWVLELAASAGLILSVLALSERGWTVLLQLVRSLWQVLLRLVGLFTDLLHKI